MPLSDVVQIVNEPSASVREYLSSCGVNKFFLLCDENTEKFCLPLIKEGLLPYEIQYLVIPAGEEEKTLSTVTHIWQFLSDNGATRNSMLINLGGGVLCDMGGFVASTFKRGLRFMNIPTTLLAQIDASLGGKTGFNFNGLKNEIGVIQAPSQVIISPTFLATLSEEEFKAGFAEMLKHALIDDETHLNSLIASSPQLNDLTLELLETNLLVKHRIVTEDPEERNIRKSLNFGHTIGHAFESLSFSKGETMLHGYAVAYGMVCELLLSEKVLGFSEEDSRKMRRYVETHFGQFTFKVDDIPAILEFLTHDKKNEDERINFSLLSQVGDCKINQYSTVETIKEVLVMYLEESEAI